MEMKTTGYSSKVLEHTGYAVDTLIDYINDNGHMRDAYTNLELFRASIDHIVKEAHTNKQVIVLLTSLLAKQHEILDILAKCSEQICHEQKCYKLDNLFNKLMDENIQRYPLSKDLTYSLRKEYLNANPEEH